MSRRASHKLASPSVVVIANALRERVLAGEYRDNGWLPTERELAEEFGVSRTIVRRAIEELERQGLVVRSPRCRPVVKRQATTVPSTEARRLTLGLWLWPSATFPGGIGHPSGDLQNPGRQSLVARFAVPDHCQSTLRAYRGVGNPSFVTAH